MCVLSKVIFGTLTINSYDRLDYGYAPVPFRPFVPCPSPLRPACCQAADQYAGHKGALPVPGKASTDRGVHVGPDARPVPGRRRQPTRAAGEPSAWTVARPGGRPQVEARR